MTVSAEEFLRRLSMNVLPKGFVRIRHFGFRLSGSRNTISLDELKGWAVEYLDEFDEELARFPKLVGQAHWNLWMVDRSLSDALFAVLVFHPNKLEFFCGTGDSFQIRDFSEHELFNDPAAMSTEMKGRFRIPEPSPGEILLASCKARCTVQFAERPGGTVLWHAVVIGSLPPCASWTDPSIPFSQ